MKLLPEFKQVPTIWNLKNLLQSVQTTSAKINGQWVPCRTEGAIGIPARFKAAWAVFTGRADAVVWPEGQ